jgi:DNA-binding NarL/FixJ family response regulator
MVPGSTSPELTDAINRVFLTTAHDLAGSEERPVIAFEVIEQRYSPEMVRAGVSWLTEREQEVLRLVGTGMTNREIARRLKVTERTVKNHVSHILEKLNFDNRVQAAIFICNADLTGDKT